MRGHTSDDVDTGRQSSRDGLSDEGDLLQDASNRYVDLLRDSAELEAGDGRSVAAVAAVCALCGVSLVVGGTSV